MVYYSDYEDKEGISKLKIGDFVYQFRSSIVLRDRPFLEYTFFEITGETEKFWILENGYKRARKTDLKELGGTYGFETFKLMDGEAIEMKKKKDEYFKNDRDITKCSFYKKWRTEQNKWSA